MILVTTPGKVGREAARLLAETQTPVRLLARHPDRLADLTDLGVESSPATSPTTPARRRRSARSQQSSSSRRRYSITSFGDHGRDAGRGRPRHQDHQQRLPRFRNRPPP